MSDEKNKIEERVKKIEKELDLLSSRVDELTVVLKEAISLPASAEKFHGEKIDSVEPSETWLEWLGRSSLLSRVSATSFVLVVALLLRTLTDSEIIDQQVGSVLGMVYAAGLIGWGWYSYHREGSLAPVFSVAGSLLFFAIVLEAHEHFAALPTMSAYLLLTAVGVATAAMSHLYRLALPLFVGTLGMCLTGVALDFPSPIYPYLFALLLVSNVLGTFATRLQRCTWLRWVLLIITVFMGLVWSLRLGMWAEKGSVESLPFSLSGLFLAITVFGMVYLFIATLGVLGKITERVSRFDLALPTINVLWTYLAARHVVEAGLGNEIVLGMIGVVVAVAHGLVAWWLYRRQPENAPGINSFVLAAVLLLVMALPSAAASKLIALAILSGSALLLARISQAGGLGGLRMISYFMQIYAAGAAVLLLQGVDMTVSSAGGAGASAAVTGMAFYHYLWARRYPPPGTSKLFSRFDEKDRTASVVLMIALACGFFTLRVGIYRILELNMAGEQLEAAFSSAQSLMINLTAVVLMGYAFFRSDREIRNLAIFVMLIGGVKVFFFDLFNFGGLAVVVCVFSFGMAALLASYALSRWQRRAKDVETSGRQGR